jgi:hypothetical protein
MERLTNEEVRVDESMDRYLGPRSVLEGMKPKLLDLVLNGPVLNSVSKAALRQIIRQLYSALAAYEDTGLTPEEVLPKDKADEIALKLMRLADLESICSYTRLRELAEADKDERVVVLPCKVGDVVYGFHGEKTILPMVAKWIETNTDGWCIAVQYAPMAPRFYRFSDFGKTVFLTREEAEKALEAMKK